MHKLRVFLDSNVLISGIYSSKSSPGKILLMHINQEVTIVVSKLVIEEVVTVFEEKLHIGLSALQNLLTNSPPEIVKDAPISKIKQWTHCLHFDDAAILASAIIAKPDYFITGDKHFLLNQDIKQKTKLRILTPAIFVKLIAS